MVSRPSGERVWLRNQSSGELDDNRLVDGVAGERAVFRRRADATDAFFDPNKARGEATHPPRYLYLSLIFFKFFLKEKFRHFEK